MTDQLLRENTSVTGGQVAIRFPGDNTTQARSNAGAGADVDNDMYPPVGWEQHWHIDGLGDHNVKGKQSFFGDVRNFTALVWDVCHSICICAVYFITAICNGSAKQVGVVLQDATEEFMGNLVVYPGSHTGCKS